MSVVDTQPHLDEHVGWQDVVLALILSSGKLISPKVDLLEGENLAGVKVGLAPLQQRNVADTRFRENCFAY